MITEQLYQSALWTRTRLVFEILRAASPGTFKPGFKFSP